MTQENNPSAASARAPASTLPPPAPLRTINPRVVLLLLALVIIICGSVVLTDKLSPRNRHPVSATSSAPASKGILP